MQSLAGVTSEMKSKRQLKHFSQLLLEIKEIIKKTEPGKTLPVPDRLESFEYDGKKLHYFKMGLKQKEVMIMVHGFGGFFMDWTKMMMLLCRSFKTIAPDLPGWGFSPELHTETKLEYDIEAINALVDSLGEKKVTLVGLSYGGAVCWGFAALYPEKVKKLVLLNPMPPFPLEYMHSTLYRLVFLANRSKFLSYISSQLLLKFQFKLVCLETIHFPKKIDPFYIDLGFHLIRQPKSQRNLHRHSVAALKINWKEWEEKIKSIKVPTMILQGSHDKIFSLRSAKYLKGLIPGSELIEVQNCGHAMVFDQYRKAVHLIKKFC